MSLNEIKSQLISLYTNIKIRKITDIKNMTQQQIESEIALLQNLPIKDIISYIQNSIDILIELKSNELYEEKMRIEKEKKNYKNKENPKDINGLRLYEDMLIQSEKEIRNHIKVRK